MDKEAMQNLIIQLQEAILNFVQANSESEIGRIIQKHPELLDEEADYVFGMLIDMQTDRYATRLFTERRQLLHNTRIKYKEIQSNIRILIGAGSWSRTKRVIDQHQELLSSETDVVLRQLIDLQKKAEVKQMLIEFQDLLQRCRIEGIEAVFAEIMRSEKPGRLFIEIPEKFEMAVAEIRGLADRAQLDPSLHRRRIELMENILPHITGDEFPGLRAALLGDLGNAYVILPTSARNRLANLNKAISCYQEALRFYPPEVAPLDFAQTQNNMGNAYYELPSGNRTSNLNKAIECFHNALRFRTPTATPIEYAATQDNLGNVYAELQTSNRAQNLQKAIAYYEEALRFRNPASDSFGYATTQNNLGTAYLELQIGDSNINQERAIACFKNALSIWRLQTAPFEYASAQSNLGTAYSKLLKGNQAENIQRGIQCFEEALKVYTSDVAPRQYSETQTNLGIAYHMLPIGDRAANLHKAITCYKYALPYCPAESAPLAHAKIQFNLGNAYAELPIGDRNTNRQWAIGHYEIALRYRTPDIAPLDYSLTQNNMGNVYVDLMVGNRIKNIQKAITCYNYALRFRTPETTPLDYAQTQLNLGLAYTKLPGDDRTINLNRAIQCFQQALRFYKPETTPFEYAHTETNLGIAYELSSENDASDVQRAIVCYQEALRFYPFEVVPVWHQLTAHNLGNVYFKKDLWEDAHKAYTSALDAGDILYRAAATEAARQSTLPLLALLHSKDAYCLARLGHLERAVEQLEKGRTRILYSAFARDQAAFGRVSSEQVKDYEAARRSVKTLEAEMRSVSVAHPAMFTISNLTEISAKLRAAQRELETVVDRIKANVPDFIPSGVDFENIAKIATFENPLVYLNTTPRGTFALIIPSGVEMLDVEHAVWIDEFCTDDLHQLFSSMDATGDIIPSDYLAGQIEGNRGHIRRALDTLLPVLNKKLMEPLITRLRKFGFKEITLIPSGLLCLLPLYATCLESVNINYAPSARILRQSRKSAGERNQLSPVLLGIGNPLPSKLPLAFACSEVEGIACQFSADSQHVLCEHQATRLKVLGYASSATHLHFACHGRFDYDEPLDTALLLADKDQLTLRNVLNGDLNVSSSRLAVLSACQTAIIDFSNMAPDEAIGFPAGFLVAGVPGVVSSLWPVDDQSTALLMQQFYRNHLVKGMQPAEALRTAQLWLRDATNKEIDDKLISTQRMDKTVYDQNIDKLFEYRPYEHPYYWAAFSFTGT